MRPPVEHIAAPEFPRRLPWINSAPIRMSALDGPALIEFWDFCRPNSIRTLPYLKGWHERYASSGLTIVGVHTAGFPPAEDPQAVTSAVQRLGVPYPVVVDLEREIWELYGNLGWPARYLFNASGRLTHYHYGEGAYAETELAIQALLGVERQPLAALKPEDEPGALLVEQSPDVAGAFQGAYEAGGVWAVLEGEGHITVAGRRVAVEHPGCYALIEHDCSAAGVLELEVGEGVICHAVCFTPGLAPA